MRSKLKTDYFFRSVRSGLMMAAVFFAGIISRCLCQKGEHRAAERDPGAAGDQFHAGI